MGTALLQVLAGNTHFCSPSIYLMCFGVNKMYPSKTFNICLRSWLSVHSSPGTIIPKMVESKPQIICFQAPGATISINSTHWQNTWEVDFF